MLVIFWSGKGWLVPAVTFGASLLAEVVSESITGNDNYYQTHGLAFALALWTSAMINGIVFWNYYSHLFVAKPPRGTKKKRSSRKSRPGWVDHSFLFVNQGAWVVILAIGGLGSLISRGI